MKKVIIAVSLALVASSSMAADNKKVAECLVVASVAKNDKAMKRALQLADSPRVAMAEANNLMDFLGRLPTKERRQTAFNGMLGSCIKIGVAL